MTNFIINELNQNDVNNQSVMKLDMQSFRDSPHLLWSKRLWLRIIEESIVKLAIRIEEQPTDSMLGNIAIVLSLDETNVKSYSFKIYTLAIDENYKRHGLALKLLHKSAEQLMWLHKYTRISNVNLTVEKDNPAAYALYKKCGFSTFKETETKYKMSQSVQDFHANMNFLTAPKPTSRLKLSA